MVNESGECWFDHEKLQAYREAIGFVGWLSDLLEGVVRIGEVRDQLDRASTSIPLNGARASSAEPSAPLPPTSEGSELPISRTLGRPSR